MGVEARGQSTQRVCGSENGMDRAHQEKQGERRWADVWRMCGEGRAIWQKRTGDGFAPELRKGGNEADEQTSRETKGLIDLRQSRWSSQPCLSARLLVEKAI